MNLNLLPVLDARQLSWEQLGRLVRSYDSLCSRPLAPLPEMSRDEVRARIDTVVADVLGIGDFSKLRDMLGREPSVCLQSL